MNSFRMSNQPNSILATSKIPLTEKTNNAHYLRQAYWDKLYEFVDNKVLEHIDSSDYKDASMVLTSLKPGRIHITVTHSSANPVISQLWLEEKYEDHLVDIIFEKE